MERLNKSQTLISLFKQATITLINDKKASIDEIENIVILFLAERLEFEMYFDNYCLEIFTKSI